MLRARALLRLGRPSDALDVLRQSSSRRPCGNADVEARLLIAAATSRCESVERGLESLFSVHRAALGHVQSGVLAEVEYEIALVYWTLRRFPESNTWALAAQRRNADLISARAVALRGWILIATERFSDALELFESALDTYEQGRTKDEYVRLGIVHAIAHLHTNLKPTACTRTAGSERRARERRLVESHAPMLPILVLKTIYEDSWAFALEGDARSALRGLRRAGEIAPTLAWRVSVLATQAAIMRGIGESTAAWDYAEAAFTLAREINWDTTSDEERMGLLHTAEQVRYSDVEGAFEMVRRFEQIEAPLHTRIALDARAQAYRDFVIGAVHATAGNAELAHRHLRSAYLTYDRIGFAWRAIETLIELDAAPKLPAGSTDAGGLPESAIDMAAQSTLRSYPNSFLRRRIGSWLRAYEDEDMLHLTGAQREVLRLLVAGSSPATIAVQTHRALKTVRHHIAAIHAVFGTNSSTALLAVCRRRGIGA